jgi:adenosylcobinamide-GDP ribazoletransferase
VRRGLRLAVSLFTAWRVDVPEPTREDARWAMTFLPLVGLALGLVAALVTLASRQLVPWREATLLAATLGIAVPAYLSRGLHLDGLADTADGLASLRPPAEAVAVMRRGDVGPAGVLTLVLVLLLQVGALAGCVSGGHATEALVLAVTCGRVAALLSVTPRTPAVPGGLGALVAGTVPRAVAFGWAALLVAGAYAAGAIDDRGGWRGGTRDAAAVVLALAAAHLLRARAVRRLGGVTGDVLGAQVEVATTVTLLGAAIQVIR